MKLDDTVTLTSQDGEQIVFDVIAGIALKEPCKGFYAIMVPQVKPEGMGDDEALVFKVEKTIFGKENYNIVTDDDIIAAVFDEYNRLLDAR